MAYIHMHLAGHAGDNEGKVVRLLGLLAEIETG
jgi:hypothetical protein